MRKTKKRLETYSKSKCGCQRIGQVPGTFSICLKTSFPNYIIAWHGIPIFVYLQHSESFPYSLAFFPVKKSKRKQHLYPVNNPLGILAIVILLRQHRNDCCLNPTLKSRGRYLTLCCHCRLVGQTTMFKSTCLDKRLADTSGPLLSKNKFCSVIDCRFIATQVSRRQFTLFKKEWPSYKKRRNDN